MRVSPDVYVVWGALQPPPPFWETWRPGHEPPDFALEICSEDRIREYGVNPAKYDRLGAGELVIYDPQGLGGRGPLSRYARDVDGAFVATNQDAVVVYSQTLDVWLHATTGRNGVALNVCRDREGTSVVLLPAEQRAAQAEARAARAEESARLAQARADRIQRETEALRAELAQWRARSAGR